MPRVKQASKQKSTTKAAAVTVLGATGLGFSLLGSTSASTMPAADIAHSDNTPPNQRFVLSEEEMADVSLATFHLLDKENVGSGVQLARAGGCRGCAARGCRVKLSCLEPFVQQAQRFLCVSGLIPSGRQCHKQRQGAPLRRPNGRNVLHLA